MAVREIPLIVGPLAQSLRVTLEGVPILIRVRWNARAQTWYLSFFASDGTAIAQGIALRAGTPVNGRLGPRPEMPPGQFFVIDTSQQDLDPGPTDLGARVLLTYLESATVREILSE